MIYFYLVLALVVGYLFGNINFARIFSWHLGKKDITKIGSTNPGTMNMLRTQGLGRALLTLLFEALKCGLPALCAYIAFEHYFGLGHFAYVLVGVGAVLGHCFPVFYKFKGGKGVACTFGLFVFHPDFWWISLVMFVLCFITFFFIEYGFIISFIFIFTMTIYATCFFAINQILWYIPIIVLLWLNVCVIVIMHRGNIKRLIEGTENRVNFREKIFKKHKKNPDDIAEEVTKEEQNDGEV